MVALHEDGLAKEDIDWDPCVHFTSHTDKGEAIPIKIRRSMGKAAQFPTLPSTSPAISLLGTRCTSSPKTCPAYSQCVPCRPCGPTPLASSCNEPCVRQCQNSNVVIEPSPRGGDPCPDPSSAPSRRTQLWDPPPPLLLAASSALRACPSPRGALDLSGFGSRYCGRRCPPWLKLMAMILVNICP
ncbi:feather keratin Cos2-3-like [Gallus gallus]|uniref:feather keratin Cos2-3-like n=1 Tax=Gallus gallus TaxID=9031 RepID=UPI001F00CB4F|nr:feather keratin Cos2-3-like [Gallus gallus]